MSSATVEALLELADAVERVSRQHSAGSTSVVPSSALPLC